MKFAIIIPTHNRPDLLKETIASAVNESKEFDLDIVIIDDGSIPPVDISTLRETFNHNFIFHRNDEPAGLAFARNKGVQLTDADIIIHLDDDDKLNSYAVSEINDFFTNNTEIEVALLGVNGFGPRKEYFEEANRQGLNKILSTVPHKTIDKNTIEFSSNLFPALLKTVPICFQNYAIKRSAWIKTTHLRLQAYFNTTEFTDHEHYTRLISGPLRDSEWTMYATLCSKIALLNKPIYEVRCEGQGYVSHPSMRAKQTKAQINIKKQLLIASQYIPELKEFLPAITSNLSETYFNEAYYQLHTLGNRKKSLEFLLHSLSVQKNLKYAKLFIKTLLPSFLLKNKW